MNSQEVRKLLDSIPNFFEERTIYDENTGCYIWNDYVNEKGYGQVTLRGLNDESRVYRVHKISYLYYVGDIEEGNIILHTCNNPNCCNPEHLYQGTNQDRVDKMVESGNAKFHFQENKQYGNNHRGIRILAGGIEFDSYVKAAEYFGVSDNAIKKRIKTGKEGYAVL